LQKKFGVIRGEKMQQDNGIKLSWFFLLLNQIANNGRLSQKELAERTGISTATITRYFAIARDVLGMEIVTPMGKGNAHYIIKNWGVLNQIATKKKAKQIALRKDT
jgi:predicted DNA-binding transcriptional regulator YafY